MEINTLDQSRVALNLADAYAVWMEAERATHAVRLRWRTTPTGEYLYAIRRTTNQASSLGPRSPETEAAFERAQQQEERAKNGAKRLLLLGRMYKAARLPVLPTFAGQFLRQLDRQGLLDQGIQVVGTNALVAYEVEAGRRLAPELHATEDFDVSLLGPFARSTPQAMLEAAQAVDPSWTVSMERSFQLINKKTEQIDLLVPPSRLSELPRGRWQAVDTEGQEDLVGGMPVEAVVADMSGMPARLIAPDPRRYALHKWLIAQDPQRKPEKRRKDLAQALQMRTLIETGLPAHAFDEAFLDELSPRLKQAWSAWGQTPLVFPTPAIPPAGARRPRRR